ncbi:MAG TPA: hypothetical protein VLY85_00620 [Thermoplasmata archaeon]|nr:hypothetical protein [Thermoplasmata archaeon]
MSDAPSPRYRTGALWLVLAGLLLVGTVASAFVVYGVLGLFASGSPWVDLPAVLVGGLVASIAMLLLTGVLYRVDRLRGVPHTEVRLFE